jgi:hypothetical protein
MHPPRDWNEQCAALRSLIFDPAGRRQITRSDAFYAHTDLGDVERTAVRMAQLVLGRSRRGALPIMEMYARSLAGTTPELRAAIPRQFFHSAWFDRYGELPDRGEQLSIEEAFYRFLCDEQIGDPEIRQAEFADAVICALAVQPRPAFRIPPEVRVMPYGYRAIVQLGGRDLEFATDGKRILRAPIPRC